MPFGLMVLWGLKSENTRLQAVGLASQMPFGLMVLWGKLKQIEEKIDREYSLKCLSA